MKFGLFQFAVLAILFLSGCDISAPEQAATATPETWLDLRIGEKPIQAQLAISTAEKRKGLMHRSSLARDNGMLFIYERPQQVSFWMANTEIPLDLGLFTAEGVLAEIHRLIPYDTTSVRSKSDEIQFALEMNQGWFASQNLFPGSQLDLTSIKAALRKRGVDPVRYGL